MVTLVISYRWVTQPDISWFYSQFKPPYQRLPATSFTTLFKLLTQLTLVRLISLAGTQHHYQPIS